MGSPRNSVNPGVDQYVSEAFRMELFANRVTQGRVAERLHLGQPSVSARLNGSVPLSASEIASLADLCGKPVADFFPTESQLEAFQGRMNGPAKVADAPSARSSTDRVSDYGSEGSRNFTLIPGGLRSVPVATDTHRHLSLVTHSG